MIRPQAERIVEHVRRLAGDDRGAAPSDADLLRRFVGEANDAAFTALVERHGAMVWQVCRAALGRREDAEDVFQATFLVLARRAAAVRKPQSLASWLHGVALRLASKVRTREARRRADGGAALEQVAARPMDDLTWRELRQVLHEELGRLSEKHRLPILLCHLEGRTQDEAARELGWTVGRLRGRLLRGRELLRGRLARRGLAPAVPLMAAALLGGEAGAAPPETLVAALGRTIAALVRHEPVPAPGPLALAERLLRESALFWKRVAVAATVLPLVGVLGLLAHLAAAVPDAPPGEEKAPVDKPAVAAHDPGKTEVGKDRLGDSLPAGAVLRLGSLRFRAGGVVRALAFSPDGKTLLCAGWDRVIRRWDAATGAERASIAGPEKGLIDAAVSADGRTLVGGSVDGKVHVFDLAAGKEVRTITVAPATILRHVAVTPDGRTAVVGGDGKEVWQLDLAGDAPPRVLVRYQQAVSCVALSPDGRWAASASHDGTAHVHATDTGTEVSQPRPKDGAVLHALCFTPDGKALLASEGNPGNGVQLTSRNACSFWDVRTGALLRRVEGVADAPWVLRFAPDGKTFAAGTSGGMIHLWDADTARPRLRIKAHADNVQALAFRGDGGVLASGGSERGVLVWDTTTGKQVNALGGHQERVTAVAAAPDGKVIATAGWDATIRLWDARDGRILRRLGWPRPESTPVGTDKSIHALILAPDGRSLVAAGYDNKVWLWDLDKGEVARSFPGIRAALSPDGKYLATAGWGGVARLYETATGKEIRRYEGHRSGIAWLDFTPDGQTLVTVSVGAPIGMRVKGETWDNKTIWLWDVATGRVRRRFGDQYGAHAPRGPAISPDGRMLSNGEDLWELATGGQRATLTGHGETATATAFTPDGRFLASASFDGTVRLWRLPGGAPAHTFTGHRGWVLALAVTPDGKALVSGSLDTTALVWKVPGLSPAPTAERTVAELEKGWDELASADAKAAYRAIADLAAAPGQAVPLLGAKLKPVPIPDATQLARRIADLDSADFAARTEAAAALEKLGELAVPDLRAALARPVGLEAARRIEKILEGIATRPPSAETLRGMRAVEALEAIATPGARDVLQALSRGAPGAAQTRDARDALRRLGQ